MRIYWDPGKNKRLIIERGISLDQIAEIIYNEEYIDILRHPQRENQKMFVVNCNNYIWIVPFVVDENSHICLKTAYPSRKYNRKYGRKKNERP
jgi:uncharacterized DUF497 family protein